MRLRSLFRPAERRIWLHVGLPKCGSTSIQHHLAASYDANLRHGLCYPGAFRSDGGYRSHLPLAKLPPAQIAPALQQIEAEARAARCTRIVLSCEDWANAVPDGNLIALCEQLRQVLPEWRIRVLAYFRNPTDFVESCYAQFLRGGLFRISRPDFFADGRPGLARFLARFEEAKGFPLYSNLGYARHLLAQLPGQDISLRSLEPSDLPAGDLIADVCKLLGVPRGKTAERHNTRISPRKLAELEYVQSITDQATFAALQHDLMRQSLPAAGTTGAGRAGLLQVGPNLGRRIAELTAAEGPQLQALFGTRVDGLCRARAIADEGIDLLSEDDREQLRGFVARYR